MAVATSGGASADALNAEVRALERLKLAELRTVWRSRWGVPPKLRSVRLLRAIIAWRMQSEVRGGLDAEIRRRLRSSAMPRIANPPVGTRLTREYRGVLHQVEIGEVGVKYAGREFGSLSEVARLITGVRWNGPRFFGIRGRPAS
jgi:hypothetical protein